MSHISQGRLGGGGINSTLIVANLCALAASTLPGWPWGEPRELRLNISSGPSYVTEDGQGFVNVLVAEIASRSGIPIRINNYEKATERSLVMVNDGEDEGEVWRAKQVQRKYPNLRAVPESIIRWDFSAFTSNPDIKVTGWESLKPYAVGYVIGWKIFETNSAVAKTLVSVRSPEQMFGMLGMGRPDVVLLELYLGAYIARQQGVEARLLEPPLASIDMFMHLHKKHADLLVPLAKTIRPAPTVQGFIPELRSSALSAKEITIRVVI